MTVHQNQVAGDFELPKTDLYEQIKFVCWGRPVSDVAAIATTMLISCLVLKTNSLEEALDLADKTFALTRGMIERDYNDLRKDVEQEPPRN